MHELLSLPLAGILGLGLPEIIVILVLTMGPLMVIGIIGAALYFKHRQRQEWHELARIALEKGQPLPPYPGRRGEEAVASVIESGQAYHQAHRTERRHSLTGGLVLLAVGAAVFLGLPPTQGNRGFLIFAYVPAFIGVALLISATLDALLSRKRDAADSQPPKT
jgi:hypothetical protein